MGVIVVIGANRARLPYAAGFFLMSPRSPERALIWIHASAALASASRSEAAAVAVICCSQSLFNMKVVITPPPPPPHPTAALAPFEMQLFKPVNRFSYHHLLAPKLPRALRCS